MAPPPAEPAAATEGHDTGAAAATGHSVDTEAAPTSRLKLPEVEDRELAQRLLAIAGDRTLPRVPVPSRPVLRRGDKASPRRLWALQQYIVSFEYNHTGTGYFRLKREAGLKHLAVVAKQVRVFSPRACRRGPHAHPVLPPTRR